MERPIFIGSDRPVSISIDPQPLYLTTLSAFAMGLGIVIHNVYARRPDDGQRGWGTA